MGRGGPVVLTAAHVLEQVLGDPMEEGRPGSFRSSVEADRHGSFPDELCDAALQWGIAEYLVPEECGGRLRSLEECLAISRVLSRRDLTAAVALGANLLASLPVWLRGTDDQKRSVAELLRRHGYLSFALSERDHGADVAVSAVTAGRSEPAGDEWFIDGKKWLINNAGHASAATVAARTGDGFRGLTLFLVDRDRGGNGDRWLALPKIATHGLRGSAFGGIAFSSVPASSADVIGRTGEGLSILLKTLQVTRVLVSGFALGALDSCLRTTLAFARDRRLYGPRSIVQLEPVARRLVDAYSTILVGETVAVAACRAAHVAPSQLPLMSSCVKYFVPQTASDAIESLGVVLGARSYIAGEHWHGIFEKMRRDCAVTTLFDGSVPVTLNAIADQLPALAKARASGAVEHVPDGLFSTVSPVTEWLDEKAFDFASDSDAVIGGIVAARDIVLEGVSVHRTELLELLDWCVAELAFTDAEAKMHVEDRDWRRSGAAYDVAARYAHLQAAGCCAHKWVEWRSTATDPFITSAAWLVLCLRQLTGRMGRERVSYGVDEVDTAALARLEQAYDQRTLFSDVPFPLSGATS